MKYDTNIRFLAQFYALPELEKEQFLAQLRKEQEDKSIAVLGTEWGRFASLSFQTEAELCEIVGQLLAGMTLEQKVRQMTPNVTAREAKWYYESYCSPAVLAGEDVELDIPGIRFTDGPAGIVMGFGQCTQFPAAIARAASFDRDLETRVGEAIGKEGRALGANFFGGVCINLVRHPAWGRTQETYGEDPYLLGEMGSAFVRGIQQHLMAGVKHYAVNSMENARFQVNVEVDERSLREVYLPHFKKCVEAGCAAVMSAYNRVNGEWCGHNRRLLRDILKEEWGFDGFVISDFIWGIRDTEDAINGGLDMEMHIEQYYGRYLVKAVQEGYVDESLVDEAARRILSTKLRFARRLVQNPWSKEVCASGAHIQLAREAAEKSIVLLKNQDQFLPICPQKTRRITVVGRLAKEEYLGDMKGSTGVFPPYCVTVYDALKSYASQGIALTWCSGEFADEVRFKCRDADVVVVVAGLTWRDEGEFLYVNMAIGGDRDTLALSNADQDMIKWASSANKNCVVCLQGGSVLCTSGWDESVKAILMTWYPGMEGGHALADILFGRVNPSAKMPLSVPASAADTPYFDKNATAIPYDFYHGYFLHDQRQKPAKYPFGFGLSYTEYRYANLQAKRVGEQIEASVEVANAGQTDGEEIVQLYVGYEGSRYERHAKDLKSFQRVLIGAGETVTVTFRLGLAELACYSPHEGGWVKEEIAYRILVGPSSDTNALLSMTVR